MSTEHDDIEGMIAALEAKRSAFSQAIDQAIAALMAIRGLEPGGPLPGGGGPRGIRSDAFLNKTIPEATKQFLGMCNKTPQAIESIADALRKGGVESKAANFVAMVQTILRRVENQTGEIFRIPNGEWALPEWYDKRPVPKGGRKGKDAAETSTDTDATSSSETANAS